MTSSLDYAGTRYNGDVRSTRTGGGTTTSSYSEAGGNLAAEWPAGLNLRADLFVYRETSNANYSDEATRTNSYTSGSLATVETTYSSNQTGTASLEHGETGKVVRLGWGVSAANYSTSETSSSTFTAGETATLTFTQGAFANGTLVQTNQGGGSAWNTYSESGTLLDATVGEIRGGTYRTTNLESGTTTNTFTATYQYNGTNSNASISQSVSTSGTFTERSHVEGTRFGLGGIGPFKEDTGKAGPITKVNQSTLFYTNNTLTGQQVVSATNRGGSFSRTSTPGDLITLSESGTFTTNQTITTSYNRGDSGSLTLGQTVVADGSSSSTYTQTGDIYTITATDSAAFAYGSYSLDQKTSNTYAQTSTSGQLYQDGVLAATSLTGVNSETNYYLTSYTEQGVLLNSSAATTGSYSLAESTTGSYTYHHSDEQNHLPGAPATSSVSAADRAWDTSTYSKTYREWGVLAAAGNVVGGSYTYNESVSSTLGSDSSGWRAYSNGERTAAGDVQTSTSSGLLTSSYTESGSLDAASGARVFGYYSQDSNTYAGSSTKARGWNAGGASLSEVGFDTLLAGTASTSYTESGLPDTNDSTLAAGSYTQIFTSSDSYSVTGSGTVAYSAGAVTSANGSHLAKSSRVTDFSDSLSADYTTGSLTETTIRDREFCGDADDHAGG
jgi:epidermal growth factor receptor substrate 15